MSNDNVHLDELGVEKRMLALSREINELKKKLKERQELYDSLAKTLEFLVKERHYEPQNFDFREEYRVTPKYTDLLYTYAMTGKFFPLIKPDKEWLKQMREMWDENVGGRSYVRFKEKKENSPSKLNYYDEIDNF